MVWYGALWYGRVLYNMVWSGLVGYVWYFTVWYCTIWYGTVRYGNRSTGIPPSLVGSWLYPQNRARFGVGAFIYSFISMNVAQWLMKQNWHH